MNAILGTQFHRCPFTGDSAVFIPLRSIYNMLHIVKARPLSHICTCIPFRENDTIKATC